ncbi:MAG: hypothetical protein WA153_13855, partial [Candidatus Acidiferrales bacterium]
MPAFPASRDAKNAKGWRYKTSSQFKGDVTMRKYELPEFLTNVVSQGDYEMWLHRKAVAHVRRDRGRGRAGAKNEDYKVAIHRAVTDSKGRDAYTGEPLDWKLIRQWSNAEAEARGVEYKNTFALLPSVDHVFGGELQPCFKICSWRTNDAKSDLKYAEFLKLCE